jgi:MFS family permease
MTRAELRASLAFASLYALRMFGLFLILPVFAVHASGMPGGADPIQVGLVLGIYSLTQGVLQLPFGMASDRLGRKPVIIFGLLLFALGSAVAALADDIGTTLLGRAVQGAGAISAALTASIADHTRDSQRTKAMAMVGASIGLTFALSLVLGPLLYAGIGMSGLFAVTGVLALAGIAVVVFAVPPPTPAALANAAGAAGASVASVAHGEAPAARTTLSEVLRNGDLMRLNVGIFALHLVQMAMFVVLPAWLIERAGLPLSDHWMVYLPVVLASFAVMTPALGWGERTGRVRTVFLVAMVLVLAVQLGYALQPLGLLVFAVLLLVFFAGFNVLEALIPSLVSRFAPADARGTALGVYNTVQALGLFAGGAVGGWASRAFGPASVFLACAAVMAVWLAVAAGARRWPPASAGRGRRGH